MMGRHLRWTESVPFAWQITGTSVTDGNGQTAIGAGLMRCVIAWQTHRTARLRGCSPRSVTKSRIEICLEILLEEEHDFETHVIVPKDTMSLLNDLRPIFGRPRERLERSIASIWDHLRSHSIPSIRIISHQCYDRREFRPSGLMRYLA
jgi:hypothetical protein